MPGDQYGHPYIDQSQSTGLKRRVDAKVIRDFQLKVEPIDYWDIDEEGELVKLSTISIKPPQQRQRKQKGQAKRKYKVYKRRNQVQYRKNRIKAKRDYASNKGGKATRTKLRNKRVRKNPARFKETRKRKS